jgi:hypothetical protein
MNTKWLKQNAMLLGLGAVFALVLGGLIWLQQQAAGKRQEIDNQLAEQMSELDHLRAMKPAPSRENIEILKQSGQKLDRLYKDLIAAVGDSQIQTQEVARPVGFLQSMSSRFARLRQSAETAGVKLPEGFAFGFSRYAGPTPTLPARGLSDEETKKVLTQLMKQLRAIEKLSELLIESRVDEVIQIRRAEVEPGSPSQDALEIPITTDPKGLYDTLPFEFQFTGTTPALRTFLNNLSKSEWFFAVRRVQITGEAPSAATSTPVTASSSEAAAARRIRLGVTIRIDLIEFPQQPAAKPSA